MRISWAGIFLLFIAGVAGAQHPYPGTPDWISSDTQVSTGAAFADIDRDGWLDFVVANGNDIYRQKLVVYYNKGDGTFPQNPDWSASDLAYNGHLDVADVNGDGWVDVAVVHLLDTAGADSAAKVYLNNSGTLSSLPDWSSTEKARAFGVAFGDVNNDGLPDLAVATGWAYSPAKYYKDYVYMNIGGQLELSASWQSADTNTDQGALWVDGDNDGWLDLVMTGANKETRVYRNVNGTLNTTHSWSSTDNPNQDAIMMDAADVDGDGFTDLFVTDNDQLSGGSGRFRQYSGIALGFWTGTYTWSYFDGYGSAIALADVDADDDLDMATGAWWDYTRLFYNDGTGFPASPSWNTTVSSVIEKIVFGDVDLAAHSVKTLSNTFPAAGSQKLFHLTRRHFQSVTSVKLDGVELLPSQFMVNREHGWITVHSAPVTDLKVEFTYSISQDMGVTNWDSSKGNYLYYNQREIDWLLADSPIISASGGGTVEFALNARMENAYRNYILLGGVTGTKPGTLLPGGYETLPLNWDPFTDLLFNLLNSPVFTDFLGKLDALGKATAWLNAPPLPPSAVGVTIDFAYALNNPFNFTSNPVGVEIVP